MNWIKKLFGYNIEKNVGYTSLREGKVITNQKTKKTNKPRIKSAPTNI